MDANKKISFGFNKLVKKPVVVRVQPIEEKKVELVDCLEGQSIKIKDAVETIEEPLIIPIKDNKKNLFDRVKEAKAKRDIVKSEVKEEDDRPDSELTLDELAARTLIKDAKNRLENNTNSSSKVTVLPIKEDTLTIEGEKEPTLEDYENVPISDYGMAMLRGMGWKEGMGIGKNPTKAAVSTPELRPKGLGLGATKIVKTEKPVCDKEGNALILKRGAYAKIIAGSHKGNYCEVQGLDDEAGRVIVRTSPKGEILTLNEFLIVPITKEEFSQGAKVLNNAKYEEYKEISDRKLDIQRKVKKREEKDPDDASEKELNQKRHSRKNERDIIVKREQRSDSGDSEDDSSPDNRHHRKKDLSYKSESEDERGKYHDKSRSKYKDKKVSSSDSEDKYEKSRSRYRDSSDSDRRSRKRKSKDKKKKKDRHRDRSRSRRGTEKSSSRKAEKKRERRSRDRSSSYDRKGGESSKKQKSKSRHRRRSTSSSSEEDYKRSRR